MRLIDRYILRELLRTTALTTGVLVTVTAFGAAIKPLASDGLLTFGQTAKYIGLAIIPMLQFALPFAAGFAGTLSLHRLTSDNEILAMAAGGISYRRILAPIAIMGLVLALLMVGLTQWVVPRFWHLLEQTIAKDVTRLFQASIQRGEPFEVGDHQIYADNVIVETPPAGSGIDTRLTLLHLAAANVDETGRIDRDVTAGRAVVDVYRDPGFTYVKIAMADAVVYDPDGGVLGYADRLDSRTIVIPTGQDDTTRDRTFGGLREIRRRPEAYGGIRSRKTTLIEAMRDHELWRQVGLALEVAGVVEFAARHENGPRYHVYAERLAGTVFHRDDGGPILVQQWEDGQATRRLVAGAAQLSRHPRAPGGPVAFDVVLTGCDVSSAADPDTTNRRRRIMLENLGLDDFVVRDLEGLPVADLVEEAGRSESAEVHAFADAVVQRLGTLDMELTSRHNERYALSVTAMLLLVLGATLAMWKRDSLPLHIYLLAFLPSIADIILIAGGSELTRSGYLVWGTFVTWMGSAVLVLILGYAYWNLSRH